MNYCSYCKHKDKASCRFGERGCYSSKVSVADIYDKLDEIDDLVISFDLKTKDLRLMLESYIEDIKENRYEY